ncbi:hypothetical protein LJR130_003501 [Variovorax sp. LjRoot130]|uniref:hypothetical protein n=1 Tax=Variovorax sp. LjRoot130 TaxID=3342261 RepID=UPI003ECCFC51
MNRMLLGYSPDFDIFEDTKGTALAPSRASRKAVVFDTETTGQAAELLNAAGRPGFGATLGRLVRATAGGAIDDAVATELVALLQSAARRAMPAVNAPTSLDASSASTRMGRFFGIELEGLSPEDQEFEAARRFVQLAKEAARQASAAPSNFTPAAVAQWAVTRAARRYAPGWRAPARARARA